MADGKLSLAGKLSLDTVMKELQIIKSTQKRYAKQFLNNSASGAACSSCIQVRASSFKTLRMPLLGSIPSLKDWQNHFEKPKISWMVWSSMDVGTVS